MDHPAFPNKSAIHALGVKGQAQHTGAIDRDDPARAPERAKFTDDCRRGAVEGLAGVAQAGGDLEHDAVADEKFPMAGRRYGAGRVVRIRPGADDRAVADPAGRLARPSTGRSSSRQIAVAIARDGADGATAACFVVPMFDCLLQFEPTLFGIKIVWVAQGDAGFQTKGQRPLADQQHVARALHHRPRC